jgi:hypothetical protein
MPPRETSATPVAGTIVDKDPLNAEREVASRATAGLAWNS